MEESYEDHVRTLFDLNSDVIFSNGMQDHARVILVEFFKRAEESVVIFCKDLLADVYNHKHITAALRDALRRGVEVKIAVQEDPQADIFINAARQYNENPALAGRVEVKKVTGDKLKQVEQNFAVMDSKAYRFESNKNEHKAEASANRPKIAKVLLTNFEKIWNFEGMEKVPC